MNIWKLALLWVLSFSLTSLLDAGWHLGLFGKAYGRDIRPLARMAGEKMAFNVPFGLLSQILVVSCIVFLVLYKAGRGTYGEAFLIGATAGILAVTVYGVTNYALFKDWSLRLALLEIVWGPVLGGLSGAFVLWLKRILVK